MANQLGNGLLLAEVETRILPEIEQWVESVKVARQGADRGEAVDILAMCAAAVLAEGSDEGKAAINAGHFLDCQDFVVLPNGRIVTVAQVAAAVITEGVILGYSETPNALFNDPQGQPRKPKRFIYK